MEEIEIWKDVVDYEGLYKVSNLGKVFSVHKNSLKCLHYNQNYACCSLYKDGIKNTTKVHILMGRAFLNKDYLLKKLVINHINFKRDDNRLSNLEVVTPRVNANHKHISSFSKYTGVNWNVTAKKWVAKILVNRKRIHLGLFTSEVEASQYYEDALVCVNENRPQDIKVKEAINTSKYLGVCFNKKNKNWNAFIRVNKKSIYLGTFKTEQEAAEAYQNAKQQLTT